MRDRLVLVINGGSSSIKLALRKQGSSAPVFEAQAERLNTPQASYSYAGGVSRSLPDADTKTALNALLPLVEQHSDGPISVVGHRVVHGGEQFTGARLINDEVLARPI